MRGTKLKVGNDARLRSDGFRSNESGLTADLKTSEERIFALTKSTFHQSIPDYSIASPGHLGPSAAAKLMMLRLSGNWRWRESGLALRPLPQSPARAGAASNAAISTCPEKSKASMR